MRDYIKAHFEKIPFILVIINAVCFYWFLVDIDSYYYFETALGDFTQVSLVFIAILYSQSKDWGYIAKRSLLCLLTLWASNFVMCITDIEFNLYVNIYMSLIYIVFVGNFIWALCNK